MLSHEGCSNFLRKVILNMRGDYRNAVVLADLFKHNGECPVSALRDVDHLLLELSQLLIQFNAHDLACLAPLEQVLIQLLHLLSGGLDLKQVILTELLEAFLVLLF